MLADVDVALDDVDDVARRVAVPLVDEAGVVLRKVDDVLGRALDRLDADRDAPVALQLRDGLAPIALVAVGVALMTRTVARVHHRLEATISRTFLGDSDPRAGPGDG